VSGKGDLAGHAFISYVREDESEVNQLQRTLETAGIRVWRDTEELWPGEDWRAKIRHAITDNALVFIACFSRRSLDRKVSYQNEELTVAIDQLRLRRPDTPWLIPVRFDSCDIPDLDIGGGRTLASLQRADLFGDRWDGGAARLVTTVLRMLGEHAAMRVAIAEHSGLFRRGLVLLLKESGAQITASTSSGAELLAAIRTSPPDAVILDTCMHPTFTDEGIRAAAEIRGAYPEMGILVLSAHAKARYATQLMDTVSDGVGYMMKDDVPDADALMDCLARVAAGETLMDAVIIRDLLRRKRKPGSIDMLNEREHAVLTQMAEGRSNFGIARHLLMSPRSVESYVTSVFAKLGFDRTDTDNNRVRAVLAFLRSAEVDS
jgi:DNA-binding NarL/FixJ family response regulator